MITFFVGFVKALKKTFHFLTRPCMLIKGQGSVHSFTWEDHNIPVSLPQKNPGYTYESGILRGYLLGFLQLIVNDEAQLHIFLTRAIKIVPVSMVKDGLTLKTGFQADPRKITGLRPQVLERKQGFCGLYPSEHSTYSLPLVYPLSCVYVIWKAIIMGNANLWKRGIAFLTEQK